MFKKNSAFEIKFIHKLFIWTIFQSSSKTLLSNKNVRVMPLDDVKQCKIVFWQMSNIIQQIEKTNLSTSNIWTIFQLLYKTIIFHQVLLRVIPLEDLNK